MYSGVVLPAKLRKKIGAKAPIKRHEQTLQIGIFNQLYPLMKIQNYEQFVAFHVPNGGGRSSPAEAAIFKTMGVVAGVADIVFMFKGGKTVFVELKAGKAPMEDSQERFQGWCADLGFEYILMRALNVQDAVDQTFAILRANGVRGIK